MKKNSLIFIQPIDPYREDVVVACDIPQNEIIKWLKKQKVRRNLIDWVETDRSIFEVLEKNEAVFCWNEKIRGSMIILKNYQDNWKFWETLMHEIYHLIFNISKITMLSDETEAQAYLFEYLFHSIRRKLQKVDKI